MICNTVALRLLLTVGAISSCAGFVMPQNNVKVNRQALLARSTYGPAASPLLAKAVNDQDDGASFPTSSSDMLSARQARIQAPFLALLGSQTLAWGGAVPAAYALATFDDSLSKYFPGATNNAEIISRVSKALQQREYATGNVLLGSSLCPDEINDTETSLVGDFQSQFAVKDDVDGGVFNLGGLGGLPFGGTTGFGAFFSHTPDKGKVVILFGPHVGISDEGIVGKVERLGKGKPSTSCGAAVGAYKAIMASDAEGKDIAAEFDENDFQEQFIIQNLKGRLGNLKKDDLKGGDKTVAIVTNKMYDMVYELTVSEVEAYTAQPGFWDKVSEVTLLGGIVVNRGHGEGLKGGKDYFQPLTLKTLTSQGQTDLYQEVFGDLKVPKQRVEDLVTFDLSIQYYFPGALTNSAVLFKVGSILRKRSYFSSNTLLGSSFCSDEINHTPNSLERVFRKQLTTKNDGGVFDLGGLGGLPFVGSSGFGAFFSHCPDQGKVMIMFGPHVGISDLGTVGKVERIGKEKESTSCGAAVGAYKAIMADAKAGVETKIKLGENKNDVEEEFIIEKLRQKLSDLAALEEQGGGDTITYVTNKMYDIVSELMMAQVDETTGKKGFWDNVSEVTLLGGIVINRGHGKGVAGGEDFFQPLSLKVMNADGELDLFKEAFES